MSDSLRIAKIRAEDEPAWRSLWTDYLAFYETTVSEQVMATSFERLLSDDPHFFHGLLARQGDEILGLTHFMFHPHMQKPEDVCYLQDLFTIPSARGKGVARALIEAVYDAADTHGSPTVYWLTQDFNTTARKLYDKVADVTPFIKYQRRSA